MRTIAEIEQAERLMRGAMEAAISDGNLHPAFSAGLMTEVLEWVLGGDGNGFNEMVKRLAIESMAIGKAAD